MSNVAVLAVVMFVVSEYTVRHYNLPGVGYTIRLDNMLMQDYSSVCQPFYRCRTDPSLD